MSELHDPTRQALSETVRALVKRHGGPTAVSKIVNVDRTRVHAWMKGDIGIDRLGQLAHDLAEPIVVRFVPDIEIEAAAPEWARRLTDDLLGEIRENRRLVLEAMSEALAEELARYGFERALGEQSDDAPAPGSGAKPPAGVGRQ